MKKLVINTEYPNGIVEDMTAEEIAELQLPPIPYEQRVQNRIHEIYSLDDEIAMLWKDPNDPEVIEYRAFVEQIKAEERGDV